MNTKLLRRIQKRILKEPEHFYMGWWFTSNQHNCGTTACLAVWAVVLSTKKSLDKFKYIATSSYTLEAAKKLDLTKAQSEKLFYASAWEKDFKDKWFDNCGNPKEQAKIASDYIDFFIKENGGDN